MNSYSTNTKRVWDTDRRRPDRTRGWSERVNWDVILATLGIVSISAVGWSVIGTAVSHLVR